MAESRIEWTDRSDWNPIRGCTRASEGCRNCYAEAIAARFSGPGQPWDGFAEKTASGPRWTGKVALIEDRLTLPLKWRKPSRIFVNSASDLFHESVPDKWIDRVFAVMALSPQHTFQILTKRAKRMREYFAERWQGTTAFPALGLPAGKPTGRDSQVERVMMAMAENLGMVDTENDAHWTVEGRSKVLARYRWPLPNVWLGVTAEDQTRADERIPDLLATPAAKRFVSVEPMLGPVDLGKIAPKDHMMIHALAGLELWEDGTYSDEFKGLDWIIAGGESGPNARPSHPDWFRSLRDQCAAAGVPFFFKQWGEWASVSEVEGAGHHVAFSDGATVRRVGKRCAGSLLDGREHKAFPEFNAGGV